MGSREGPRFLDQGVPQGVTKSKPLVAVDTNILIWGIRQEGPNGMIERAGWLFDFLEQEEAQIIVPSVVVSEYLIPTQESDHRNIIAAMSRRFIVAPFDVRCTSLAAALFYPGKSARGLGKAVGHPAARVVLRADCLIAATAKLAGATRFYSNDAPCRETAKLAGMQPEDLPDIPPSIFQVPSE